MNPRRSLFLVLAIAFLVLGLVQPTHRALWFILALVFALIGLRGGMTRTGPQSP